MPGTTLIPEASYFAATAASFAIEQKGLPRFTTSSDGREVWNGDDPWDRLHSLMRREETDNETETE